MPFHPYMTVKDTFSAMLFIIVLSWFVFYMPNYLGHADNYVPANPSVTPSHIVPEWYFLPFYANPAGDSERVAGRDCHVRIDRGAGLPALARHLACALRLLSPASSRCSSGFFAIVCIGLGYLGAMPAEGAYVIWARILTALYFAHFLVFLPLLGLLEKPKALPNSIAESVFEEERDRACRRAAAAKPQDA